MESGKVFLVGAGPGDPELLTLKAAKVLHTADVVLHDELVSPEILRLIPRRARIVNVGKRCGQKGTPQEEINRLLVVHARLGFEVVRLKGGDPFIFSRGGEELEYVRRAGIAVEVVPGITAALGAAAAIRAPLTHRDISSSLIFVTGSNKQEGDATNWPDRFPPRTTVVVYMPGSDLGLIARRLLDSGVREETPCAIISGATSETERIHISAVRNLATAPHLSAPRLLVVGEVVRCASPRFLGERFSAPELGSDDREIRFEPRKAGAE
jgi:uroporphyrin-III C-methyltransferase